MKKNAIAMHSSVASSGNLVTNLKIAKEVGFDCIELTMLKIRPYLEAGNTLEDLAELTKGFEIVGIGWLQDIERQGADFNVLMQEAKEIFSIAKAIGAKGIECLTGPIDVQAARSFYEGKPYDGYRGLLGMPIEQQMELLRKNVCALADLAAEYGLCLYLEPLGGWATINKISQAYEIAKTCGRDNVKCVIDTFHAYCAGDTPEQIAKMDKDYIYGVHVSDSLALEEGPVQVESVIRNCSLGEGVVDYKAYCDAVKATGYDGWWNAELFSQKQIQMDPLEVAKSIHQELRSIAGS